MHLLLSLKQTLGRAPTLQKNKKRESNGGESEGGKHQRQRRALQNATNSYSPSKVAKEWRNIPLHTGVLNYEKYKKEIMQKGIEKGIKSMF